MARADPNNQQLRSTSGSWLFDRTGAASSHSVSGRKFALRRLGMPTVGIPFVASAAGGTAELIHPDDRDHCLFQTTPAALVALLRTALASGQRPARVAVSQNQIKSAWCDVVAEALERRAEAKAVGPADALGASLVSVCWDSSTASAASVSCLRSIVQQEHRPLEILLPNAPQSADLVAQIAEYGDSGLTFVYFEHPVPPITRPLRATRPPREQAVTTFCLWITKPSFSHRGASPP